MAYERQISPTSTDELSTTNCNAALGFVGLTVTDTPPNEHNSGNSQGKDSAYCHLLLPWGNMLQQAGETELQYSSPQLCNEIFLGDQMC
jgi:hypothetical protein